MAVFENLNFNYNWNGKLNCDCFSTIRLSGRFDVGDEVNISFKNEFLTTAKVVSKVATRLLKLTDYVCYLDTGYCRDATIQIITKMYPDVKDWDNQIIYIYTLTVKYPEKSDRYCTDYAAKVIGSRKHLLPKLT
jgi:hypothetical protein